MRKLLFTLLFSCLFGMARGQTAIYWFDAMSGTVTSVPLSGGVLDVDASALDDGLHALHIQCVLTDGSMSPAETRYFVRVSEAEEIQSVTMLCTVDGELYSHEVLAVDGGLASWKADLSGVSEGLHSITLQAVTASGELTTSYNSFFLRVVEPTPETLRCSYMIDNDTNIKDLGIVSQDGTVHFDLDASELSDGLHSITYILYSDKGGTNMTKRYFVKIPVGGNKLTKYQFWVNDNVANVRTTTLSEHQDPLTVVDLLSVESCPLRSELFHFEITDGTPMMYAKNTLKGWFYDRTNHIGIMEENYVDYSVSAPVTVSGVLTPGQRETTAWPEANTVKWYTLEALAGDSLRLKLNCATTVQLFAPSGAEVFKASGADAVKWGGLHVGESGTFYLALHDVTAKKGNTITIDYQRIDRYAVLKQDVTAVGNGGPSTITFQGNGFDELTSVDLQLGETTIRSASLQNSGKATVSVKFDFNKAPLGKYKAVFHFQGGDLTVANCITVNNPIAVSTSKTVSYAKQFLLSRGNEYRFKLKNRGNMTAYDVPLQLRVYTTNTSNLAWVSIDGEKLTNYGEQHDNDDIEGFPYKRTYALTRTLRPSSTEPLSVKVMTNRMERIYVYIDEVGGPSDPVTSVDPNDIYGYQDEFGSKVIRNGQRDIYYTIEFENDPAFATAPAHDIYVTDQLDANLFDLSTFAPTSVKIGNKEAQLTGEPNGTVTISMLPEIYAVAQVEWSLNEQTGAVSWHISSLDPMTVEPTEDPNAGVLPVNTDGNGIGQLSFDISLKENLAVGTEIPNKATIIFDENDPIETPTWTNTIGTAVIVGDVNDDGAVNLTDASWIVRHYVGRTPAGFNAAAADVNEDGSINLSDAQKVVRIFVGKSN